MPQFLKKDSNLLIRLFNRLKVFSGHPAVFVPRMICMNGIEKNHSRVVAVFLDELESLMVIGSIGVVCQVLDFIQVFFVERIGKRFPIIVKSCFAGRLAFFSGPGIRRDNIRLRLSVRRGRRNLPTSSYY